MPGRNTQTAPVLYFALGRNYSWMGNQNYSPDPLYCKKNMWDFKMHFPSASTCLCLPQGRRRFSQSWCLKRLSCPSSSEGSPVCIVSLRNQTHGFLCKENCCKIPMPLVSSTHRHPSTPLCHLRVLAGQRHRQQLIAKVSTAH